MSDDRERTSYLTADEVQAVQAQAAEPLTTCQGCVTPSFCRQRGECDHYALIDGLTAAPQPVQAQAARQPLTRQQIDALMTEHYPLDSLLRENVDAFEACVRDLESLHGIGPAPAKDAT